jgi:dienelactone hydrolase
MQRASKTIKSRSKKKEKSDFTSNRTSFKTEDGWTIDIAEEEVSFVTDDGWRIKGTLTTPALTEHRPVAAILFLHSPAHEQELFSAHGYPGFARLQAQFVTLRIDIRGRGKSEEPLAFHCFSEQQREKLYLDVKAALNFLAAHESVDAQRLTIFAEEISADSAVLGAAGDSRVRALVLLSGRLTAKAKEAIPANDQIAILAMVSSDDRIGFQDMTDAYKLSRNTKSDIHVYRGLGMATAMFSTWRYNRPQDKPLDYVMADWLTGRLNALGSSQEVSFETEDGWTIFGDLVSPVSDDRLPAVILVHSSVTDRHMYHRLVDQLLVAGFIVLSIDFRGRGKSRNKGNWLQLRLQEPDGPAEIGRGYLDVKAAVDFLISQGNVDAERIGVVGTVIGARYALLGAAKDQRIKAVASVIGYVPPPAEQQELETIKAPVLYICSRDLVPVTQAMSSICKKSAENGNALVVLDGGAYGYSIFTLNPTLGPTIVRWLKKELHQ